MPASLCSYSIVLSSEMPLFSLILPSCLGLWCYRFIAVPQEGRDCTGFYVDLDPPGLWWKMVPVEGVITVRVLFSLFPLLSSPLWFKLKPRDGFSALFLAAGVC